MQINLHSHTTYSDGADSVAVMAMEAQKLGHSAYVVTDHVNPSYLNAMSGYLNWHTFSKQRKEINSFRRYTNFPIIQGIELNLEHEEVLVFGYELIKPVLDYPFYAMTKKEALDTLIENKKHGAVVLCHPRLDLTFAPEFYAKLFPILDGYEHFNHGNNYFEHREVPKELQELNDFSNSDAHCYKQLALPYGTNEHNKAIKNDGDIVKFIKRGY